MNAGGRGASRRHLHLWLLVIPALVIALIAVGALVYFGIRSNDPPARPISTSPSRDVSVP